MADEITDLGIRITVDASGAVTGIDQAKTAVTGLGDKAAEGLDKAGAAGERMGDKVAAGGKEAAEGLNSLLGPSAKLEAQITKTGNALSPRGIVDGAAKIRIALEDIEAHAKRTGQAIGPELAAQMQRAEAAIATAIPRAGRLADTIADTRKQAGLAAEGYKTLGVAGGGLISVFGAMDDAGKGWVSTLGKVGIAGFGVVSTLQLLRDIGKAVGEGLAHEVDNWNEQALAMQRARDSGIQYEAVQRAISKGLIENSGNFAENVKRIQEHLIAMGLNHLQAKAYAETIGLKIPESAGHAEESLRKLDVFMSGQYKSDIEQGKRILLENADAIKQWAEIAGTKAPESARKWLAELARLEAGSKKVTEELRKFRGEQADLSVQLEKTADAAKKAWDRSKEAVTQSVDAQRKAQKELDHLLNDGVISLEEHSEKKRELQQQSTDDFIQLTDQELAARNKAIAATEKWASATLSATGATDEAVDSVKKKYDELGTGVEGFSKRSTESLDVAKEGFVRYSTEAEKSSERAKRAWEAAEIALKGSVDNQIRELDRLEDKFRSVAATAIAASTGGGGNAGLAGGTPPVGP